MERAETVPLRMLTTPRLRPMFIVGMLLVFFQSHFHRVVRGVVGSGAVGDGAGDLLAAHPRQRRRCVRHLHLAVQPDRGTGLPDT